MKDGYYLVRHFEDGGLSVEYFKEDTLYFNGEWYTLNEIYIHWIADEPLALDVLYSDMVG